MRVKLIADEGTITFGQGGVGLRDWPAFLDGFRLAHTWDSEAAAYREEVPSGVQQVEMTLVVKTHDVTREVSRLMDMIYRSEWLAVGVESAAGMRQLRFKLVEFGGVAWHPAPGSATLAEVPIRGETANTTFTGEHLEFTTAADGRIVVPYAGDVAAWPTLRLPPGARFKLREEDTWQTTAAGEEWVAYTDPAERRIEVGGQQADGLVAFWAQPPRRVAGGVEIFVEGGGDVTVQMVEKWRRAWA